jgi:hypothetical protein
MNHHRWDGWDVMGVAGVLLLTLGVWDLAGRGWAVITLAIPMLALYGLREFRLSGGR